MEGEGVVDPARVTQWIAIGMAMAQLLALLVAPWLSAQGSGTTSAIPAAAAAAAGSAGGSAARAAGGFIGCVHPSARPVPVHQQRAQDVFGFGAAMICNEPSVGNMTLREAIEYHCNTASVNQVSGLLLPPTERGQVNNPQDTDPWVPLSDHVGMIQGAARFSKISAVCPQLTGVFIDDFLQQYSGRNKTGSLKHCFNVSCPAKAPSLYGSSTAGYYCCPTPHDGGHCAQKACSSATEKDCACCAFPGTASACQGAARCSQHPQTHPNGTEPCSTKPTISLQDMKDIKAALQGKTVGPDGTVNHSSTALTPHLQLGIVWYDFEMQGQYDWVREDGARTTNRALCIGSIY